MQEEGARGERARKELADFLKTRRRRLTPAAVGLPLSGHRRTPGLRREEVSLLAGVSLTYYSWLEQGRDIKPSRPVIDALARTLRLTAAEHAYVLRLSNHAAEPPSSDGDGVCPPHVQRILDALGVSPAYAITPYWSIVGWNRAYEALYPGVASAPLNERNLLWLVFTDPYVRSFLVDWQCDSRRFLAQFRSEAGLRLNEPAFAEVTERLQQVSDDFRVSWATHDVAPSNPRERRFRHPIAGTLTLERHRLAVPDCPELQLVVYTAAPDSGTQPKLDALLERSGGPR